MSGLTGLAAQHSGRGGGPLALLIVVLLLLTVFLLVRNMNRRLARMRDSFPEPLDDDDPRRTGPGAPGGDPQP